MPLQTCAGFGMLPVCFPWTVPTACVNWGSMMAFWLKYMACLDCSAESRASCRYSSLSAGT
eukprot:8408278-Prorocentrum_lima.AAC.1